MDNTRKKSHISDKPTEACSIPDREARLPKVTRRELIREGTHRRMLCNVVEAVAVSLVHVAWHLGIVVNRKQHSGRCIVTSKTSVAHATGVVDDERGHFLFGHVCRNGRTESVWAIFAPLTDIWFATQTKQRKSCK